MKKTYITPEVEIIEINTEMHLLNISMEISNEEGDTLTDDAQVGSKGHNIDLWGFED